MLCDASVVIADWRDREHLVQELPLRGLAARIAVEQDTDEVLGDHHGGQCDIIVLSQGVVAKNPARAGDEHAGVEDQSSHGSVSSCASAAASAAMIFAAS